MFGFSRRWLTLALALACNAQAAEPLHGAGATFPAPVYDAWAGAYARATGTPVRYDAVGSGLAEVVAPITSQVEQTVNHVVSPVTNILHGLLG